MNNSARFGRGKKVDLIRLKEAAVGRRELHRAVAFIVTKPGIGSRVVAFLRRNGYEVQKKEFEEVNGRLKASVVAALSAEAAATADKVDTIILASGNGDFADLVRMLKRMGKKVEVWSFPNSLSQHLADAADELRFITDNLLYSPTAAEEERDQK